MEMSRRVGGVAENGRVHGKAAKYLIGQRNNDRSGIYLDTRVCVHCLLIPPENPTPMCAQAHGSGSCCLPSHPYVDFFSFPFLRAILELYVHKSANILVVCGQPVSANGRMKMDTMELLAVRLHILSVFDGAPW